MLTDWVDAQDALLDYARDVRKIDDEFVRDLDYTSDTIALANYEQRIIEVNRALKAALDSANAPDWMYPTGR